MNENGSNSIVISVSRDSYFRIIDALGVMEFVRRNKLDEQKATKAEKRYMSEADMALEAIEVERLKNLRQYCTDHFYETMGVAEDNRIRTPTLEELIHGRNRRISRIKNRKPKGKKTEDSAKEAAGPPNGNKTNGVVNGNDTVG